MLATTALLILESTKRTDIVLYAVEPVNILAILVGGVNKSICLGFHRTRIDFEPNPQKFIAIFGILVMKERQVEASRIDAVDKI